MGLNDFEEKLRYAEWALDHGTPNGNETMRAAWDYVVEMTRCGIPKYTREAWRIIEAHREYVVWRKP